MSKTRDVMIRVFALAGLLVGLAGPALGHVSGNPLERGFKEPPDSAKPRAWWHWLNGNVTKEGITADLEWMKRSGIDGMQMFDGNLGTPQFVDKRLAWMTPDWKDAFRHAGAEAQRLGLEMSMAASGGWSETAGPWVKPEEAMKKVVWSETVVKEERRFRACWLILPRLAESSRIWVCPQRITFQQPAICLARNRARPPPPPEQQPTFYRDIKVIAYRSP